MPQTSSNVVAGQDARASDINKIIADLTEIYSGGPGVPVGGVIDWWSDNTIPLNYKEVNGQTIADAASPLNGLTLPDATSRFRRGVPNQNLRSSPSDGGTDSHNLSHSHSVNAHSHDLSNHTHGFSGTTGPEFNNGGQSSSTHNQVTFGPPAHNHNYSGNTGGPSNNTSGAAAPGTNSQLGVISNIPNYRGFVPIMRIK
jgi:hypothetical protein